MNRIRLILIVAAVLAIGVVAIAGYRAREPRYQGRTLSEWIEEGNKVNARLYGFAAPDPGQLEADHDWQVASHAVKQIGYEAVPLLLKWYQAEDSPMKKKLIEWQGKYPSLHFKIRPADDYHKMANVGIWLIGNPRNAGWPYMFSGTGTARERRTFALIHLVNSKPDKETLVPLLRGMIRDQDDSVRQVAASAFNNLYPKEAETAGVYKIFPYLIKNEPLDRSTTNEPSAK